MVHLEVQDISELGQLLFGMQLNVYLNVTYSWSIQHSFKIAKHHLILYYPK